MRSEYKRSVFIGSFGTAIFLLGVIVFLSFPAVFNSVLFQYLPLLNGTLCFTLWRDMPFTILLNVYIFNVTNADDFLRNGSLPKLQQLGPYSYSIFWKKNEIVWNPNNTLTYKEHQLFSFNQEGTNGTEDDLVTTINGPLMLAGEMFRKEPSWKKEYLSTFLQNSKLFIQRTVREVLFEGYDDDLMELGRIINPEIPDTNGMFMWFIGRNNTNNGLYTAYTGADDLSKVNILTHRNGQTLINLWNGQTCNMINGSNGLFNPPLEASQEHLRFFRLDFCRSLTLTYSQDVIKHHGLRTKRFIITRDVLANGTENPDNRCFTIDEELLSGAYESSTCLYGMPIVMSLPHFYLGHSSYLEAVEGLSPNKAQHDFYVDVEPRSGLSLGVTARLQVNLHLRRIPDIVIFEDLKVESLVLPTFWQEVSAAVTEDEAEELINRLESPKYYTEICYYSLFTLGSVMALTAGVFIIISWYHIKQGLKKGSKLNGIGNIGVDAPKDVAGRTEVQVLYVLKTSEIETVL